MSNYDGRLATPPRTLRAALRQLGFKPRKQLGQNFLHDEDVLARIVQAAELEPGDRLLEVGPGLGSLTRLLAAQATSLLAVELDGDLAAILQRELAAHENLTVINANVLDFDLCRHFQPHAYKMLGNLPYYVTSPILRHFLDSPCPPQLMVIMLQKEVAERVVARPGDMSLLSVSVQLFGEPHIVASVPATAFYPVPKVDSAVVRIDVRQQPLFAVDQEAFFALVAAGFSQRRKMLHNALAQRFWMKPGQAPELLAEAGVPSTLRADALSLDNWHSIYQVFSRYGVLKTTEPPGAAQ